jgi:hypothetical protein
MTSGGIKSSSIGDAIRYVGGQRGGHTQWHSPRICGMGQRTMKVPAASCVSRSAAFWRGMVVAFLVSVPPTELAAQKVVRGPYLQR